MPDFLLTDCATPETWRPHLAAGTLWVVEVEGAVVGYLAARRDDDRLHIDELDVERGWQGRGIGRRLLDTAATWARTNRVPRLSLTTFRDIPWNGPFYARFGFREWSPAEAPEAIRALLAHEAELGLPDRCAMVMDL
ncbi:MAG: GNAT family N-acetyltransferase [Phenylobacterium zucineum]|nr:MAG: GNAT family N-acetyltransferase [Phenylobacterium zucineum]